VFVVESITVAGAALVLFSLGDDAPDFPFNSALIEKKAEHLNEASKTSDRQEWGQSLISVGNMTIFQLGYEESWTPALPLMVQVVARGKGAV